jgi:hypothetical protein
MDNQAERPFDAAEALIREAPKASPATWGTVSLAKFVKDLALTPPSERNADSRSQALAAMAALTHRGLDGHAYIRYGIGSKLADHIAALSSMARLLQLVSKHSGHNVTLPSDLEGELPPEIWQWASLCEELLSDEPAGQLSADSDLLEEIMKVTHDWRLHIQSWMFTASITEIMDWKCPGGTEEGLIGFSGSTDTSLMESFTWISDRLTETYLSDWQVASLHNEFRWIRGEIPTPCPEKVMSARSVNLVDLTLEITLRATSSAKDASLASTVGQLGIQALQMLKSGDRTSATALFRVISRIAPTDVESKNNLGFAMIQDSPREALRHLKSAAKSGYDQPFINVHNRMLCHLLLGEFREALLIADQVWVGNFSESAVPALLWRKTDDGDWPLESYPDARQAVAALALEVAESVGSETSETWQSRFSSVSLESTGSEEE